MTQTEHLAKIRDKCVELLAKYPPCESTAGWKSTIAAIDMILAGNMPSSCCDHLGKEISTAWPEELL